MSCARTLLVYNGGHVLYFQIYGQESKPTLTQRLHHLTTNMPTSNIYSYTIKNSVSLGSDNLIHWIPTFNIKHLIFFSTFIKILGLSLYNLPLYCPTSILGGLRGNYYYTTYIVKQLKGNSLSVHIHPVLK